MEFLTLEKLQELPIGSEFASGFTVDNPETGINITGKGAQLKWVAATNNKGTINTGKGWSIFIGADHLSSWEIIRGGDKVMTLVDIKKLVPCDDFALACYDYERKI